MPQLRSEIRLRFEASLSSWGPIRRKGRGAELSRLRITKRASTEFILPRRFPRLGASLKRLVEEVSHQLLSSPSICASTRLSQQR